MKKLILGLAILSATSAEAVNIQCPAYASANIQAQWSHYTNGGNQPAPNFPIGASGHNSGFGGLGNYSLAFSFISVQQHAVICYYENIQQTMPVTASFIDVNLNCTQTGSDSAVCQ